MVSHTLVGSTTAVDLALKLFDRLACPKVLWTRSTLAFCVIDINAGLQKIKSLSCLFSVFFLDGCET